MLDLLQPHFGFSCVNTIAMSSNPECRKGKKKTFSRFFNKFFKENKYLIVKFGKPDVIYLYLYIRFFLFKYCPEFGHTLFLLLLSMAPNGVKINQCHETF